MRDPRERPATARPVRLLAAIVACYPRAWRERYGGEVADLLARERQSPRLMLDLARGALDAHLHPQADTRGPSRARRAIGAVCLGALLLGGGYVTRHPPAARTVAALLAPRQSVAIAATATLTEHGQGQRGARQE